MNNKNNKTNQEALQDENSPGVQNKLKTTNKNDLTKEQIISKAFHYHSKGNIHEAAKYYNHFIKRGFNDPSVYSNFGVICIQLGKNDQAISLYQRSISIYPNNPEAYSNLGNLYKELGKDKEAEKLLRKAISINPDFSDAYSNLGTLLLNRGDIHEAEKFINKAIELNPDSFKDHSNLGIILKNKEKYKEAEISTIKAIKLNPFFTTAYNNLCSILISLDKLNDAEISVKKAIELDPGIAISFHNLSIIQTKKNEYDKAEISIRRAIKLNPNYALAHNDLGVILSKLKKQNEAENSIRTALKIDPNLAIAYSNLSETLIGIGRLDEAEECVRKALNLDNKIASAHFNLALKLYIDGDYKNSEKYFLNSIEIDPKSSDAYYQLGLIYLAKGELKDAEIFFNKSIRLNKDLTSAYYQLSNLKTTLKKKDWEEYLFSDNIIKSKSKEDLINIYFARANIKHRNKHYISSINFLKLANNTKLEILPSDLKSFIEKSTLLKQETSKSRPISREANEELRYIFIVGMFRSGSTLLESILTMNDEITHLGELNILEESFLEWKYKKINNQNLKLGEIYNNNLKKYNFKSLITTDKNLYNFRYSGIISEQVSHSKIIHCLRHPLDNILSIYRNHFTTSSNFSSSIEDCAYAYLNHIEIMSEYKIKYPSFIYNLDYDLVVTNPDKEIRSLISWLGLEWNDSYLYPHLNKRTVKTASNVQIRSPINSKSLGGWRNYINLLQPAIMILEKTERYKNIKI